MPTRFPRVLGPTGLATALLALAPSVAHAHAHAAHDAPATFAYGFIHPLIGWDHVIAMVSVGALGALIGGRAVWAAPLAFLSMMVAGFLVGAAHFALPFVELGVAASAIMLAAMLAPQVRPRTSVVVALISFFALLHGYAHGAEMPATGGAFTYAAGFVVATAALHGVGIAMAWAALRIGWAR